MKFVWVTLAALLCVVVAWAVFVQHDPDASAVDADTIVKACEGRVANDPNVANNHAAIERALNECVVKAHRELGQ